MPKIKQTKKVKETKYCSYCGTELVVTQVGAETCSDYEYFCGQIISFQVDSAYNKETGARNYCNKYTCPKVKEKKWYQIFSPHDEFTSNKVITYTLSNKTK